MSEERRKSVRINKIINVRYSYTTSNGEKKWDMTSTSNISEAGMCITTIRKFSPNDIMAFFIKIPTRPLEWIDFTGRIVASEEAKTKRGEYLPGTYTTRMEFINIKEEQRELIRQFINFVSS